jgi:hypothetical protein
MAVQKQAVLELVKTHRGEGRSVGEVLGMSRPTRFGTLDK